MSTNSFDIKTRCHSAVGLLFELFHALQVLTSADSVALETGERAKMRGRSGEPKDLKCQKIQINMDIYIPIWQHNSWSSSGTKAKS